MELKQIRIFTLLAEQLSFSRVGEILNLSQSAISKQLSLLEADLGGKLLVRDTRKVALSDLGFVFLPYAKRIVALETEATAAIDAFQANQPKDIFHLYVESTLLSGSGSMHFPVQILHASQEFNRAFPTYNIDTHIFPEYEWRATVKFKMFDVALIKLPLQEATSYLGRTLALRQLCTIHQHLVVHNTARKYASAAAAIADLDILLQDHSISTNHTLNRFVSETGSTARLVDCDNWNNLFLRLMSSSSATVVPENALDYFQGMGVQTFPLEHLGLEDCLCAFWQQNTPKEGIAEFLEALARQFQ
jgi:DNA-binding transcriptional LysR family regulator